MKKIKVWSSVLIFILVVSLPTACGTTNHESQSTLTQTPLPPQTQSPYSIITPTHTSESSEHHIGIRLVNGVGEFYDRITGITFVPRGSNYIRLAEQRSLSGSQMTYHSTFNIGLYNPQEAEEALTCMHDQGYNTVRVFLNGNCAECIGDPEQGISSSYVANLADFLRKAEANQIYVILTTDAEPATRYYINLLDSTWSPDWGGTNSNILRGGGILVGQTFWRDLIRELIVQDAPVEMILSYQLRNELFFEINAPPFTLNAGMVSTANGKTYDISSTVDQQRMMDEGLVYYIDTIRDSILSIDPTALVSVGFFWPQEPHPARIGDPRVIETSPAIWDSKADFIDLHVYLGGDLTLAQYVDNFGLMGMKTKPIIIGEFGAARSTYASETQVAQAFLDWQTASCAYGFDGWLFWTWDNNPDFYTAYSTQGEIFRLLAPVNQPDPCQP